MADRTYGVNQSAMLRIGLQIERNEAQLSRFMADISRVEKALGSDLPKSIKKGMDEVKKTTKNIFSDIFPDKGIPRTVQSRIKQISDEYKKLQDQAKKGFSTKEERDRFLALSTAIKEITNAYKGMGAAATTAASQVRANRSALEGAIAKGAAGIRANEEAYAMRFMEQRTNGQVTRPGYLARDQYDAAHARALIDNKTREVRLDNEKARAIAAQNSAMQQLHDTVSRTRNAWLLFNFAVRPAFDFLAGGIQKYAEYQSAGIGARRMGERAGFSPGAISSLTEQLTGRGQMSIGEANATIRTLASTGMNENTISKMLEAMKNYAAFSRNPSFSFAESIVTMAQGFKELNPRVLDNAGYLKNVEVALKQEAKAMGVSIERLTERQKHQLLANRMIKDSIEVYKDFDAYLNTPSAQLSEMTAKWNEFWAAAGGFAYNHGGKVLLAGSIEMLNKGPRGAGGADVNLGSSSSMGTLDRFLQSISMVSLSRNNTAYGGGMIGSLVGMPKSPPIASGFDFSNPNLGLPSSVGRKFSNLYNPGSSIFGGLSSFKALTDEMVAAQANLSDALKMVESYSSRGVEDDVKRKIVQAEQFWSEVRDRALKMIGANPDKADADRVNSRIAALQSQEIAKIHSDELERKTKESNRLIEKEKRATKERAEKRARMMADIMEDEIRIMNARLDEERSRWAGRNAAISGMLGSMPADYQKYFTRQQRARERAELVKAFTDTRSIEGYSRPSGKYGDAIDPGNDFVGRTIASVDPLGQQFINQFDKDTKRREKQQNFDLSGTGKALKTAADVTEVWAGSLRDVNSAIRMVGDLGSVKLKKFTSHAIVAIDAVSNLAAAARAASSFGGASGFEKVAYGLSAVSGVGAAVAGIGLAIYGAKEQRKNRQRGAEFGATVQRGPQVVNITPVLTIQADGNVIFSADGMEAVEADLVRRVQQAIDDGELSLSSL